MSDHGEDARSELARETLDVITELARRCGYSHEGFQGGSHQRFCSTCYDQALELLVRLSHLDGPASGAPAAVDERSTDRATAESTGASSSSAPAGAAPLSGDDDPLLPSGVRSRPATADEIHALEGNGIVQAFHASAPVAAGAAPQMQDLSARLREGATVLDEPFHHDAIAVAMNEAADALDASAPSTGGAAPQAQRICKAQRSADPPQDCNWPFCGCDEHASRVIETLLECGWSPPAPQAQEVRIGAFDYVVTSQGDVRRSDWREPEPPPVSAILSREALFEALTRANVRIDALEAAFPSSGGAAMMGFPGTMTSKQRAESIARGNVLVEPVESGGAAGLREVLKQLAQQWQEEAQGERQRAASAKNDGDRYVHSAINVTLGDCARAVVALLEEGEK